MMDMVFLLPSALWGLLGLILPLLLHILRRRPATVQPLASFRFLAAKTEAKRLGIRLQHPWLMLLRMSFLASLCFALSEPRLLYSSRSSSSSADAVYLIDPRLQMEPERLQQLVDSYGFEIARSHWLHADLLPIEKGQALMEEATDESMLWLSLQAADRRFARVRPFHVLLARPLRLAALPDGQWPLQRTIRWKLASVQTIPQAGPSSAFVWPKLHLICLQGELSEEFCALLGKLVAPFGWSLKISLPGNLAELARKPASQTVVFGLKSEQLDQDALGAFLQRQGRLILSEPLTDQQRNLPTEVVWQDVDAGLLWAQRRSSGLVFAPAEAQFWQGFLLKPARLSILLAEILSEQPWVDAPLAVDNWPELTLDQLHALGQPEAEMRSEYDLSDLLWLLALAFFAWERALVYRRSVDGG